MKKLVVFDMDGVLVDVSKSYRDTVRQTAAAFLKPAQGAEWLPKPLFRLADLAAVKQSGGLNNDWDLTHRVLSLLFTQVLCPETIPAGGWRAYQHIITRCDVRSLAAYLSDNDRPLQTLMQTHGHKQNRLVDRMYRGDVGSGNIIKQIFQEIYLGQSLFEQTYGSPCKVSCGEGFIYRETLFPKQEELEILSQGNLLAIATGRPRAEADHPLIHFGLTKYFRTVLTLDDCLAEEKRRSDEAGKDIALGKPHPFMLDAVASAIQTSVGNRIYVGDMPDDMQAASRSQAGYIGIGFTISAVDKETLGERLRQAGADRVVDDFSELQQVLMKI